MNRSCHYRTFAVSLLTWASLFAGVGPSASASEEGAGIEFNRDIRPLLSQHCFACHGPDANKREADLRLDTRAGLLGEDGKPGVVQAGRPDESELFRRVSSADPDERMPPAEFGKDLAPEQIERLRRWIAEGASWQGHWSFEPIARPVPPQVADETLVATPVDRFLLAALAGRGWQFSPEADRITLIRRLSFDLTGLPPKIEDVEAFLADNSQRAYEKLVDRLLASEHYGERMAMWWLDLVRYADSVGYHGDQPVSVFPFRDYVIRSFNQNKPFDQFTLEQLAGDMLPDATLEHRIASGYNRLGMMSAEGGVQPKEYLAKYIAERVRNLGGTWLGLTTGCCECHDHKYDPLSMRDFYSLEAFFADIEERGLYSGAHASGAWGPRVQVPTPEQQRQLAEWDAKLADAQRILDTPTSELAESQVAWERTLTVWTALKPESLEAASGTTLTLRDDRSIVAGGTNPERNTYTLTFSPVPQGITGLRLEALPDDALPKKGPGRTGNGDFVLTRLVARFRPAAGAAEQPVSFARAEASHESAPADGSSGDGNWSVLATLASDPSGRPGGWAVLDKAGQPQSALFEFAEPLAGGEGTALTIELRQESGQPRHTLGRFRLLASTSARPLTLSDVPPTEIAAILLKPLGERSADEQAKAAAYYRTLAPELEPIRARRREWQAARDALDQAVPTTLVTARVPPRTVRLLPRGNWMDDSGEVMEPAFPAMLRREMPHAGERLTRADLARWLTSKDNPLTARVFANRIWKLYFGAGLSRKVDDLGAQGDWPTHPALLDWLAAQFQDSGWDVKHLVRLIVLSRAYRQSSVATPQAQDQDPYNLWLARQSRFRLDAEMVRDNALQISGLLVPDVGGPSARPYQPAGYWAHLNFPTREWENGTGSALYRRGLYTHWQRQYLHPSLLAFDAPSREECVADRSRSNTPLQSLVIWNDPTYVEAARVFAEQVLRHGGTQPAEQVAWAFRRALSRPPESREAAVLVELLESHRREYDGDPQGARALLHVGAYPVPADLAPAELAAWTSVTRALLGLHETITRY